MEDQKKEEQTLTTDELQPEALEDISGGIVVQDIKTLEPIRAILNDAPDTKVLTDPPDIKVL